MTHSLISFLLACSGAPAPPPPADLAQPRVADLAGAVVSADWLAKSCRERGAMDPHLNERFGQWEEKNRVPELRAALERAASARAENAKALRDLETSFIQVAMHEGLPPCAGLAGFLDQPRANIAANHPDLVAALLDGAAVDAAAEPELQGYGVLRAARTGFGGMTAYDFAPVLLLADGRATTDVTAVGYPGGFAAHQRAHPTRWGTWRQSGARHEIEIGGAAQELYEERLHAPPPKLPRLLGRYRRSTTAVAADAPTAGPSWATVEFLPGDRLTRGGPTAGKGAPGAPTALGTRAGAYEIADFTLTIRYDDGDMERTTIFGLPDDPGSVWIGGVSYGLRTE